MSALGVIPARGGSKGLPRKNLALLAGEPLVTRAVRTALAATRLDRIVVSTDDPEIAGAARTAGAEVVDRPLELAGDESPTEDALLHALDALDGPDPDWVVTLEPTSPLRSAALIDACLARAEEIGADALITVAASPGVHGTLANGIFEPLLPGQARRRQLREPLYRESSTVYVTRVTHLRATRSVLAEPLYAVVVSEVEAIDVNTPLDLALAEALLLHARDEKGR